MPYGPMVGKSRYGTGFFSMARPAAYYKGSRTMQGQYRHGRKYKVKMNINRYVGRSIRSYPAANLRTGGFTGIELKYFDSFLNDAALSSSTNAQNGENDPLTANALFTPVQGTGATNRLGRKVQIQSIDIKGFVEVPVANGINQLVETTMIFVALVQDRQTNAAQMSSEDMFINPAGNVNLGAAPLLELERQARFTVLRSWNFAIAPKFAVGTLAAMDVTAQRVAFDAQIPVKIPVEFVGDGGTVSDIVDNSLHVIAWASSQAPNPRIYYRCRCRFVG